MRDCDCRDEINQLSGNVLEGNQMMQSILLELQEIRDVLKQRLPEPQKPTVVRKTWYHNANDTKPPNCS